MFLPIGLQNEEPFPALPSFPLMHTY
uniref:Uncharacterized protein n=1 Tax=Rhizophora mucronata TaxID=61149 RepID=A0A2P2QX28_RHIMU